MKKICTKLLTLGLVFMPVVAFAADNNMANIPDIPAIKLLKSADGGESYSVSLQILAIMTGLTLLPAIMLAMTSFTRVIIVLGILRQAIGMQQTPSNQILVGLALFITFFIMSPVLDKINSGAIQPYLAGEIEMSEAFTRAKDPIYNFMIKQTRETDLSVFKDISSKDDSNRGDKKIDDKSEEKADENIPLNVLMPSFITSELKSAFQIGFLLFVPFLIIDLVVASVLMAMGMMMLSPLIISLPFKIMLFVLVDGWSLVVGTLASSFGV